MSCRIILNTVDGKHVPYEQLPTLSISREDIESVKIGFTCPYCSNRTVFELEDTSLTKEETINCESCENEIPVITKQVTSEPDFYQRCDLIDEQIRDAIAVRNLGRTSPNRLFDGFASGIFYYVPLVLLVLAVISLFVALPFWGTTIGISISVIALLMLLAAATINSVSYAVGRRRAQNEGVKLGNIGSIYTYRNVYYYGKNLPKIEDSNELLKENRDSN